MSDAPMPLQDPRLERALRTLADVLLAIAANQTTRRTLDPAQSRPPSEPSEDQA
jgi:hypothetical protein